MKKIHIVFILFLSSTNVVIKASDRPIARISVANSGLPYSVVLLTKNQMMSYTYLPDDLKNRAMPNRLLHAEIIRREGHIYNQYFPENQHLVALRSVHTLSNTLIGIQNHLPDFPNGNYTVYLRSRSVEEFFNQAKQLIQQTGRSSYFRIVPMGIPIWEMHRSVSEIIHAEQQKPVDRAQISQALSTIKASDKKCLPPDVVNIVHAFWDGQPPYMRPTQ